MDMKIETKRLIIRDWKEKDIDDLIEGINNLKVSKWLAVVPYPYTRKDAKWWINSCEKDITMGKKRINYYFAIELKSNNKVIGGIGTHNIDWFNGIGAGGYWINVKYQKKGYGTEALEAVVKFSFDKLKLRRLESGFFKGNPSSFKLQKKFGFKIEGLRRKRFKCRANGKLSDEYITALLKEDWKRQH